MGRAQPARAEARAEERQLLARLRLVAEPPTEPELALAWAVYAFHGVCNPLVVSETVRKQVGRDGSPLNALLKSRLAGTDCGSAAAIRALGSLLEF